MTLRRLLAGGGVTLALAASILIARGQGAQMPPNVPDNMKHYYFGLVVPGPNYTPTPSEESNRILMAHLAWVRKQIEAGKILLAGPLLGTDPKRHGLAICIVNATSEEEGKEILKDDPEVKAGRFLYELQPAYLPDLSPYKISFSRPPGGR